MTDDLIARKRPLHRVDILEERGHPRRGAVRCGIGKDMTIRFDIKGLESYLLAACSFTVFDALLVTAAVEFCDRAFQRPSFSWRRDFSVSVPVHNPELWNAPEVLKTLKDALNLLTGDDWHFKFRKQTSDVPVAQERPLPIPSGIDAIIPFSDGLDSWAAAAIAEHREGLDVLRVRVGSRGAGSACAQSKHPFSRVPFGVGSREQPLRQAVVRSRGFKFTLIGGIAAYLAGVTEVIIPESGQGSLGSVLVPVGYTHPDYRSHPLFLVHMQAFIQALIGHHIDFKFPHLWNTKGETFREALACSPTSSSWQKTRSCWRNQRWASVDGTYRQCGVCAACLLRRLSIHAAGESESKATYVWEDLAVSEFEAGAAPLFRRPKMTFLPYATAGALHMDHLAHLGESHTDRQVIKRQALVISRALAQPTAMVEAQMIGMLRTHAEEWRAYAASLGSRSFVRRWAHVPE